MKCGVLERTAQHRRRGVVTRIMIVTVNIICQQLDWTEKRRDLPSSPGGVCQGMWVENKITGAKKEVVKGR